MELTNEQFRKYNADYMEKYTDEVLTHGNGGFRTITHRKTATRYALERLVADLEPAQPLSDRVVSTVEYAHLGIFKGTKGTIVEVDDADGDALIAFDNALITDIWMNFSTEIRRITE